MARSGPSEDELKELLWGMYGSGGAPTHLCMSRAAVVSMIGGEEALAEALRAGPERKAAGLSYIEECVYEDGTANYFWEGGRDGR